MPPPSSEPATGSQAWVYPAVSLQTSSPSRGIAKHKEMLLNDSSIMGAGDEEPEDDLENDEANVDADRMTLFRRSRLVTIGRDHPDPLCEPRAVRETHPEP